MQGQLSVYEQLSRKNCIELQHCADSRQPPGGILLNWRFARIPAYNDKDTLRCRLQDIENVKSVEAEGLQRSEISPAKKCR